MIGIGDSAFYECISLKIVIIPSSIKKIGEAAFRECISLEKIDILSSVSEIGKYFFLVVYL